MRRSWEGKGDESKGFCGLLKSLFQEDSRCWGPGQATGSNFVKLDWNCKLEWNCSCNQTNELCKFANDFAFYKYFATNQTYPKGKICFFWDNTKGVNKTITLLNASSVHVCESHIHIMYWYLNKMSGFKNKVLKSLNPLYFYPCVNMKLAILQYVCHSHT